MKYFISLIVGLILGASGYLWLTGGLQQATLLGSATSNCDVTMSKVAVGTSATTLLAAGSYQWAIVEQPINATNTVSLSLGGIAVSGQGYLLTPATTSSPVPSIAVGFSVNLPYRGAISGITNTGGSTVNVLSCK